MVTAGLLEFMQPRVGVRREGHFLCVHGRWAREQKMSVGDARSSNIDKIFETCPRRDHQAPGAPGERQKH